MTLTIAQRLILGFGIVLTMTLGLGWYQLANVRGIKEYVTTAVSRDFAAMQLLRHIGNHQRDMRMYHEQAWAAYLLSKANIVPLDTAIAQKQWHLSRERTLSRIQELISLTQQNEGSAISQTRSALWAKLRDNALQTREVLENISSVVLSSFEMINKNETSGLKGEISVLEDLRQQFNAIGGRTEDLAAELSNSAEGAIATIYTQTRIMTILVLSSVIVMGLIIAVLIYRSITGPVSGFMDFVRSVGQGDLTQRSKSTGADEIGRLGSTLNEMVANLAEVSRQTKSAAENLNAATAEMQASAQQQAASTSEQSAAVQQITSTLEEITQSGSQISERAKGVAQSAEAASSASKSGLMAVSESSRAMRSVREQAEKVAGTVVSLTEKTQSVGEIIASVNEIAERSNLLALNAAIEAAAAGEAGASFSIVADEIKNLADQAKEATRQVHGLLSEIQQGISSAVMQTEEAVKRAEVGAERSKQTEDTIAELARSVEQSVATFEQIIAATNQQQIGVEQVSTSVQNIREASEQIAAGISDLEKSAAGLNAMSGQLQKSVERYRL